LRGHAFNGLASWRRVLDVTIILILVGIITIPSGVDTTAQGASTCSTNAPISGAYSVVVCITTPANLSNLVGNTTVTATASVTPAPPPGAANPIQRLIFSLNGSDLLTDYQSPYTFTLPTTRWADGSYQLAAAAHMRDGFITSQTTIQVSFNNRISTPPVNTGQFTPAPGTTPPAADDPLVVAAVGDGAGGEVNSSNVVSLIASWNPNLFLYLGDVYEDGTPTEFYNWYGHSSQFFSQFNSITNPTVGNHEYTNGIAPGYVDYWNNIPHYYSFDTRGWHFISLDANSAYGQFGPGSAQYQWLVQDLAANQAACTLAYWHEPLYNIGQEPPATWMQDTWALLAQSKVDIVLTGHDHDYQRWTPLDGSGQPNPGGITQFVVGTGGHGIQTFVSTDSRMVAGFDSTTRPSPFGALRLRLYTSHAAYDFVDTGGNFLDTGSINCKNAGSGGNPTATPTPTATATPTPTRTPTATPTPVPTIRGSLPSKVYLPGIFKN
jgi:hypothetical protein